MEFEVHTQDGFENRGLKQFETLEELMDFIKLHEEYSVVIGVGRIYINNIGQDDLF